jgi:curved DNA-binding protein CbpA
VTDYFALLDESRRPWLDADLLKQKFHSLSAGLHPDKIPSANEAEKAAAAKKFAGLNTAYHSLAAPKLRLLHLFELETGAKPGDIRQIPDDLVDLFTQVAALCKSVDAFLAEKSPSPLLAVQWFERSQEWIERLNLLKNRLGVLRGQLDDRLKSLDAAWMSSGTADRQKILPGLEELYRLFSYLNRWNDQVQERIVQLAL